MIPIQVQKENNCILMPNQQKTAKDSLEKAIGRTRYFLMIIVYPAEPK